MPDYGWVKNNTNVSQSWGSYTVPAGCVGLIPIDTVNHYRQRPSRDITVLEDQKDWVFKQTDVQPWNRRYQHD